MKLYDVPKPVELAALFGLLHPGWCLEDYLIAAILSEQGYETVALWGLQGSGKSSRMLQMLYWIYRAHYILFLQKYLDPDAFKTVPKLVDALRDYPLTEEEVMYIWDELVLRSILFRPSNFVESLEEVPDDDAAPGKGWDDIGVHYPSTKFKTDLKQYEAIDSTWAAIRTKVRVVFVTIPLIDRLAKNVKDNVTIEVFIGKNQLQLINRCFHLPGTKDMNSNFFKVILESPGIFDLYLVPLVIWRKYWVMRIRLTNEALKSLRSATDMEATRDYIWVVDAARICKDQSIKYSTSTIQQDISRGVMRGKRVSGRLSVHIEDFVENAFVKGADKTVIGTQILETQEMREKAAAARKEVEDAALSI